MKKAETVYTIIDSAKAIILDNNLVCYPSNCHSPQTNDDTVLSFYENDEAGWETCVSMNQLNNAKVENGNIVVMGNIKYQEDEHKQDEEEFTITVLTDRLVTEAELS